MPTVSKVSLPILDLFYDRKDNTSKDSDLDNKPSPKDHFETQRKCVQKEKSKAKDALIKQMTGESDLSDKQSKVHFSENSNKFIRYRTEPSSSTADDSFISKKLGESIDSITKDESFISNLNESTDSRGDVKSSSKSKRSKKIKKKSSTDLNHSRISGQVNLVTSTSRESSWKDIAKWKTKSLTGTKSNAAIRDKVTEKGGTVEKKNKTFKKTVSRIKNVLKFRNGDVRSQKNSRESD